MVDVLSYNEKIILIRDFSVIEINKEHGRIRGLTISDIANIDEIYEAMSFGVSANQNMVDLFLSAIEERYNSVGFIQNVLVNQDSRGKGFGKALLDAFLQKECGFTGVDFLFASTCHAQRKGFNLVAFYRNAGFEPVFASNGDIFMANKGQAKVLKSLMFGEPEPVNNVLSR